MFPSVYTYNFCPNPSAEASAAGYSALLGTERLAQDALAHSGSSSVMFTTPGSVPGEGISTPGGTVLASVTGSATAYVYGETGTLTVQALANPGGRVLGTTQVQLDGQDWQRVELDGLAMASTDTFYLAVYTTFTQALEVWVDAVQYEPESLAHAYVDGDSAYGAWTGTPGLSPSYQQYQHPVLAEGGMVLEGTITLVARGEVFAIGGPVAGLMDMSGDQHEMAAVSGTRAVIPPAIDPGVATLPWQVAGGGTISAVVTSPGPAFRDFAAYTSADPDPAMALIAWNNAGTLDAAETATAYTRLFGTFSPPRQQLDSGGHARWQAAAYMAAGFRIASQASWSSGSPNTVNFADVQVERAQGTSSPVPSAYQLPRSLTTIIRPSRMNYVPNPGFEASGGAALTGWAGNNATTSQFTGGFAGGFSMEVTFTAAGNVYIPVSQLITGDTFVASVYLQPVTANIQDITLTMGGETGSAAADGGDYGSGDYGSGPYGGIAASLAAGQWYRPWTSFAAPAATTILELTATLAAGGSYPATFLVDCALVEPGEVLMPYGDGSTDGWGWELGGTPGLARSYFYEREAVGVNAVHGVLQQHVPLGTTAYQPQYFVPPSQ